MKALARHENIGEDELIYSCPVSVKKEDLGQIRELLTATIEQFLKRVVASDPPEILACLNIDWFRVR